MSIEKGLRLHEFIDATGGPDACHPWLGWTSKGYGRVWFRGRKPKVVRLLAEQAGWDIEGLDVRHTCDNPPCCNLRHLVPGTSQDNKNDAIERGRHARGETHGRAKVTREQAEQIRATYAAGGTSQYTLAAAYGLSQSVVSKIIRRVYWD